MPVFSVSSSLSHYLAIMIYRKHQREGPLSTKSAPLMSADIKETLTRLGERQRVPVSRSLAAVITGWAQFLAGLEARRLAKRLARS